MLGVACDELQTLKKRGFWGFHVHWGGSELVKLEVRGMHHAVFGSDRRRGRGRLPAHPKYHEVQSGASARWLFGASLACRFRRRRYTRRVSCRRVAAPETPGEVERGRGLIQLAHPRRRRRSIGDRCRKPTLLMALPVQLIEHGRNWPGLAARHRDILQRRHGHDPSSGASEKDLARLAQFRHG